MTRSYDTAKKEAVFIALPLLVLFLIKMLNNELMSFLKLSDFSLATSIMYGQLLAKTLDVPDKNKKRDRFSTYQVYIFVVSILSMAMYIGFQLIPNISFNFYIVQIVTFIVGIMFYIPLSTLMNDLSKE
ncbi:hypothetical protein BCS84_18220 [Vibrio cyclitrophicus]|uniref:hypothetical protein n=1 Tax=Vibrio cyclitrophicus TaxID=47951 RepID=UPI0003624CBF|nr:hypothetical protein [Vibrio cyclitrophicus]CAH6871679.1 conserved membrane hypothetical protein [Vibrio chagasii]OEE17933.1 hypothetical protein OC1_07960 [Vibrio cyclitrophicus ZF207]PMP52640.1 hypothetical protein BCS84_20315 [Vibrio cyclitrophicus]CAH7168505.1 conserved membrane hypothetical protein [Vibrio chagasii]CAH7338689.1 conserved membrane hypothetical protein [Vibrio chagasii]